MKLTTRTEYALLALIYLARREPGCLTPVETIAGAAHIPPKFLEQILLVLKRARLVQSQKGQRGGYRLARPPARIALAEVVRCLDGALAPTESVSVHFYEPTPIEGEAKLVEVFRQIRDYVANTLEKTTLADVC